MKRFLEFGVFEVVEEFSDEEVFNGGELELDVEIDWKNGGGNS